MNGPEYEEYELTFGMIRGFRIGFRIAEEDDADTDEQSLRFASAARSF